MSDDGRTPGGSGAEGRRGLIGEILGGRYQLESILGQGGMGVVYRARDQQLGRRVAVKVLSHHGPEVYARFEREARVGAALDHPHVVQTLDYGSANGAPFLVMQLVDGTDLLSFTRERGILPLEVIREIGYQLADALAAAHALAIVHRDLKPENVLVESVPSFHLRVADFGLAYVVAPIDPKQGRVTEDGVVSGTPAYMSPEQVSDRPIGIASDIYSLGCLLFELVAGATPFRGTHGKLFADHLYAPIPSLRRLRAETPGALDELVTRMLAKQAAERPTAQMVKVRLAALDATCADASARSRDGGPHHSRPARMITAPPAMTTMETLPAIAAVAPGRVRVVGEPTIELLTALAVAELDLVQPGTPADVRLVLGGTYHELADAVRGGQPVVADAEPRDFARIAELLRLGVAEVAMKPLVPAEVVGKVLRALRKRTEIR